MNEDLIRWLVTRIGATFTCIVSLLQVMSINFLYSINGGPFNLPNN